MKTTPKNVHDCQDLQCSHCTYYDEIPEGTKKLIQYYLYCEHRKQFEDSI